VTIDELAAAVRSYDRASLYRGLRLLAGTFLYVLVGTGLAAFMMRHAPRAIPILAYPWLAGLIALAIYIPVTSAQAVDPFHVRCTRCGEALTEDARTALSSARIARKVSRDRGIAHRPPIGFACRRCDQVVAIEITD
jgi:hypothetical protein